MPSKPPVKPGDPPIRRPIDYTVNTNGCWVWNWSVETKGYATVRVNGRSLKAHRVAYERANGPIPDGQVIRHLCGNPSCLNPDHLRSGTPTENMRDMVAAGNQHNQKLTPNDAAEIRRIFAEGNISQAEIARTYGVKGGTTRKIVFNERFYDPGYTPPLARLTRSPKSRIDEDLATEIRQTYLAGGISQPEVARIFDVPSSSVSKIVRNLMCPDPDYTPPSRRASNQKLDEAQVAEIINRIRSGDSQNQVANEFGVSQTAISHIITGKIHHGRLRIYPTKQHEDSKPRPTLQSINGPAPTGKAEQQRRREELRDPDRKPRRKLGEPAVITENDWDLDPETGCHNWRWGNQERRPFISSEDGKEHLAYRVAWETQYGPIPECFQVNHRCDNGRCINVDHLYLGDQFDNMHDTVRVGNHATQKLTWEQARSIRNEYQPGKTTYQRIAEIYGVTIHAIYLVVNNKTFHDRHYTPRTPEVSVRRKLSALDVSAIRAKYKIERITLNALARQFGISGPTIGRIIRNETYHNPAYTPPSPEEIRQWKLSNADNEAIIAEYQCGIATHKQLAKKFGVSSSQIANVIRKAGGPSEVAPS